MKLTKCPICGSKKIRSIRTAFKVNTPHGVYTIPSVPRQRCNACEEEFFDNQSNRILKEIHDIRRQMLKENGGDFDKLVEYLRRQERKHPERLVGPKDVLRRRKAPAAVS